MSKHKCLTKKELDLFTPNHNTIKFLNSYCKKKGLTKDKVKILDWGCGRGLEVLWLNLNGYNVIGIDIDKEPIQNGLSLAEELGLKKDSLQTLLDNNKTPYSDGYFDIVYSNQVFEHIKNIGTVADEMYRITKRGGEGYHVLPAFLYPNEGHLHMPFVHWFPKNRIRYLVILFYVLIKREPYWAELNDIGLLDRGKVYYDYSVNKTFYRKPGTLTKLFSDEGFTVKHGSYYIPEIHTVNKKSYWRRLKQYLKIIFYEEELYLIK